MHGILNPIGNSPKKPALFQLPALLDGLPGKMFTFDFRIRQMTGIASVNSIILYWLSMLFEINWSA